MSLELPNTWHYLINTPPPPVLFNLVEDYGKVTEDQVEAACVTRIMGTDVRAKQNAQMMY